MFGMLHFTEMPIKYIHDLHAHSWHNDRIYKSEVHGLQTFITTWGEEKPPLLCSRMQQRVFNEKQLSELKYFTNNFSLKVSFISFMASLSECNRKQLCCFISMKRSLAELLNWN